jgi:hypothetical protein
MRMMFVQIMVNDYNEHIMLGLWLVIETTMDYFLFQVQTLITQCLLYLSVRAS